MTVRTFLYSFFTPWFPILREEGAVPRWALTASLLILAVLLIRVLLREKISLRLRYALWAAVLLRLLIPAQLPLSLPAAPADGPGGPFLLLHRHDRGQKNRPAAHRAAGEKA